MSHSSHEVVLASSPDGSITAYDIHSGTIIARFKGSRSPRHGLVLVGNTYVVASHISSTTPSSSIHLYNWWSSTVLHNLPVIEPVGPLVGSFDGLYLFAGGVSGRVYVLSIPSGHIVRSFQAHNKPVSCLKINHDGSLLISCGDDGAIVVVPIFQLVNASSNENSHSLMLRSFVAHDGSITAISSSMGACQSTIISSSTDCTLKAWNLLDGTNQLTISVPCMILAITINPTETKIYAAGSDGLIYRRALMARNKKEIMTHNHEWISWTKKHGGPIISLVMINKGHNLVSAAEDGGIYIWEVKRGQVIKELGNCVERISHVVVANRVFNSMQPCNRVDKEINVCGGKSSNWLFAKEFHGHLKNMVAIEETLTIAKEDRSRGIGILESAIVVYERLLELVLNESKASSWNYSTENDNNPM